MGVSLFPQWQVTAEGLQAVPGGFIVDIRENSWDEMSLKGCSHLWLAMIGWWRGVAVSLIVVMDLRGKKVQIFGLKSRGCFHDQREGSVHVLPSGNQICPAGTTWAEVWNSSFGIFMREHLSCILCSSPWCLHSVSCSPEPHSL